MPPSQSQANAKPFGVNNPFSNKQSIPGKGNPFLVDGGQNRGDMSRANDGVRDRFAGNRSFGVRIWGFKGVATD